MAEKNKLVVFKTGLTKKSRFVRCVMPGFDPASRLLVQKMEIAAQSLRAGKGRAAMTDRLFSQHQLLKKINSKLFKGLEPLKSC